MFKKIKEKIFSWPIGWYLYGLSKVVVNFKNDDYTQYQEEGDKTEARFIPINAVITAIIHVYGYGTYRLMRINGITIDECADEIVVHIFTPRPGYVIGKGGQDYACLSDVLSRTFKKYTYIRIEETKVLYGIRYSNTY